jgi:hypothetical protein
MPTLQATDRPWFLIHHAAARPTIRCSQALAVAMTSSQHVYEVRSRKDHRCVELISDALPFGRLWYGEPDDAIEYAKHCSRSYNAVIRVFDEAGNVIETHEHAGESKEWWILG